MQAVKWAGGTNGFMAPELGSGRAAMPMPAGKLGVTVG